MSQQHDPPLTRLLVMPFVVASMPEAHFGTLRYETQGGGHDTIKHVGEHNVPPLEFISTDAECAEEDGEMRIQPV